MDTPTLRTEPRPGHAALRAGRTSTSAGQAWHLTFNTHQRESVFGNFEAARIASACLHDSTAVSDGQVLAWVVMPDHVHCLLRLGGAQPLHTAVGSLKSGIARRVNRALERTGPLWSRAYHDHGIRADEDLRAVARYIVGNPLRAGLVDHIADYPYWNAVWMTAEARSLLQERATRAKPRDVIAAEIAFVPGLPPQERAMCAKPRETWECRWTPVDVL